MTAGSKKRPLAEIGEEIMRVGDAMRSDPTAVPGGMIVAALVRRLRRCAAEALETVEKGEQS